MSQVISDVSVTTDTNSRVSDTNTNSSEVAGTVTKTIGTGKNAQNSIIFLTIKYSFLIGGVLTVLIVINHWYFGTKQKVPDFTSDVKLVWDIIIPIITLSLGYAFGKSQN